MIVDMWTPIIITSLAVVVVFVAYVVQRFMYPVDASRPVEGVDPEDAAPTAIPGAVGTPGTAGEGAGAGGAGGGAGATRK